MKLITLFITSLLALPLVGCVSSGDPVADAEQNRQFVRTTSSIIFAAHLVDKDPAEQQKVSQDILTVVDEVQNYLDRPISLGEVRNLTVAYVQTSDLENKPLITLIFDSVVIMLQDQIGELQLEDTERVRMGKSLVAESLRSISQLARLYAGQEEIVHPPFTDIQ